MKRVVLMDLDDTILDFGRAESRAIGRLLTELGLPSDEGVRALYSEINLKHWKRLERGEITRREVLVGRFRKFLAHLGSSHNPETVQARYERLLSEGHFFIDGAPEVLKILAPRYDLYLASNGTGVVQRGRLQSAGILPYFGGCFLSEDLGAEKPKPAFFDGVFRALGEERRAGAVMVGDSLTSDILGGIRAGIATVWFNPKHRPPSPDICPDCEISSLADLPAAIEGIPCPT